MHISEGVLSAPVLGVTGAAAAAMVVYGFRYVKGDMLAKTALMSSLFFVGSFIHVPIGPSSVHLILNGLVGAVLGVCAFPAIFTALLMQVLLFQFGGFTTLGANTVVMALPALLGYYFYRQGIRRHGIPQSLMFFLAGALPVLGSAMLLAVVLAFSGEGLFSAAKALFLMHIPIFFVEGIVCLFLFRFMLKVYPDFLERG